MAGVATARLAEERKAWRKVGGWMLPRLLPRLPAPVPLGQRLQAAAARSPLALARNATCARARRCRALPYIQLICLPSRRSQDHPFGFVAKPETQPDGSTNLLRWKVGRLQSVLRRRCLHGGPLLTYNSPPRSLSRMPAPLLMQCQLPGKEGTEWEGGLFPLTLSFSQDYPSAPPRVFFPPGFVHPNVFPQGDGERRSSWMLCC